MSSNLGNDSLNTKDGKNGSCVSSIVVGKYAGEGVVACALAFRWAIELWALSRSS